MSRFERKWLLAGEIGTRHKHAARSVAMVYPSPYRVAMSSLGFQSLYRTINDTMSEWSAERAFLPEDLANRATFETLESGRPVSDHDAIGISIAYELEIFGLIKVLELAGLSPLAAARRESDPPVILGGPLTFSNPLPAAPFADVVLMGECDELLPRALEVFGSHAKHQALALLATWPNALVPAIHGETLPSVAVCTNALLPAHSAILTPNTELANMFLIEAERGCHRSCTFCVMRRSTNGGMRLVPVERVLALVPAEAKKVGLVGAAVSDHPKILDILRALVDERGLGVGISSLRADRLNDDFVRLLAKGGYRTLTVASDGPSQRLRDSMQKNVRERHLLRAAELAKAHGLRLTKVYMIVGAPGETDEDIVELARFTREMSRVHPVALGIAPFVPKYNTPLADAEFANSKTVETRLELLRAELQGTASVRATSIKEAWVEATLATSGLAMAHVALASQSRSFGWKPFYQYLRQADPPCRRLQRPV